MKQHIHFVREIPGFTGLSDFELDIKEEMLPFAMIQSIDKADVGFIVAEPFSFFSEYSVDLPEDVLVDLEIINAKEVQLLGIITYRNSLAESTINLQAPIIVNIRNYKAVQMIFNNTIYSVRHPLIQPTSTVSLQGGEPDARINAQEGSVDSDR